MADTAQAAVLWTGGKDSALALHRVLREGLSVRRLVTFGPAKADFLAHPLEVMAQQALAVSLPHQVIQIDEPYFESYRAAIARLRDEGIGVLVTGDIAEVEGQPNWVRQCCDGLDVQVLTPLWHADRLAVMRELLDGGFEVILSCVKPPWFTAQWLGRTIDEATLAEMQKLSATTGLDLCGENGEYHSLALNSPEFRRRVAIQSQPAQRGSLWHLRIRSVSLDPER